MIALIRTRVGYNRYMKTVSSILTTAICISSMAIFGTDSNLAMPESKLFLSSQDSSSTLRDYEHAMNEEQLRQWWRDADAWLTTYVHTLEAIDLNALEDSRDPLVAARAGLAKADLRAALVAKEFSEYVNARSTHRQVDILIVSSTITEVSLKFSLDILPRGFDSGRVVRILDDGLKLGTVGFAHTTEALHYYENRYGAPKW